MRKVLSDRYFLGRKCVYCDKNKLYRLKENRVKCKHCKKYYSLAKLKQRILILYYFYLELSAKKTSDELESDYGFVHSSFMQFRKLIADFCNQEAKKLNGEIELDESYFGGRRKGKRGRGANNKAIVFGILERKGKVHVVVVENVQAKTLMEKIKRKTKKGSVFYTDTFKSYNDLKQFGKHNKINHKKEFANGNHNHINGIEGFWSYAKEKFKKYHGINKTNYPLYLKEMEFRYNNRNNNLFKLLLDICVRRQV